MRTLHLLLLLFGVGIAFSGPASVNKPEKEKVEELCARMHNNTAFIGVQPFARLLVDSASKCQKSCMELHPKCTAVVFYYVYGEKVNHICFLFDRNSVNENVALVPEKPKNDKDVIRALEIVSNCHEFDPFPPLPDPFVVSSDTVGRDKRAVGFHKPIPATGPWSRWSPCNHANSQIRSQTCDYGRKIQKRQCAPKYPHRSGPVYAPAEAAPPSTPYPPYGYNHPPAYSDEYTRRMEEHKKQELQLCCYKLDYNPGSQVHPAVPRASPCPQECPVPGGVTKEAQGQTGTITPKPPTMHGYMEWGQWSECSVTCGKGVETRTRVCTTSACFGPSTETRDCERSPCSGTWSPWCEWSPCSVTCGMGKRERSRFCDLGFGRCDGSDHEEEQCNQGPCPEWLQWSEWSVCSLTCGGGTSQRFRTCTVGNLCPGSSVESMPCNEQPCACWGEWTPFSECSVTCGEGTKSRSRYCEGGDYCEGNPMEKVPCHMAPCPEWSMWGQWSECQVTCGEGLRTRSRHCLTGDNCPGSPTEQEVCYMPPCPIWGEWQEWSQCSVTCGSGTMVRRRFCNGYGCPGNDQETKDCFLQQCPVWGEWEDWSQCSVSCGPGTKERHRTCHGGYCEGERTQSEPCDMGPCSYWNSWEQWSRCSVSCGDGFKTRRRYCIGVNCPGPSEETQPCREAPCPSWGSWGPWSSCNVQCGPGQKTRSRECMTPYGPSEDCPGPKQESTACDAGPCCQWSEWCGWSVCDRDCGGGKKIRQRFCQRTTANGELVTDPSCGCPGSDKEIQDCNQQRCPPQCNWTEWCPWSQCPDKDPCRNATMTRTRQCVGDAGCRCYGFAEEKQFCRREAVCDPPIVPTAGIRRRRRTE